MSRPLIVPDELLNKIGTIEGNFIITTVYPEGRRWKVWGIKKPFKPTSAMIDEWKANTKLDVAGTFAFTPGEPIGYFKKVKS